MNYRERLVELYREQFKSKFKVRETGVNVIVYQIDGDSKKIVAHIPKNDDQLQAMRVGHYIVGFLSGAMAEQAISELDKSYTPQASPVAHDPTERVNTLEHPLE